MKRHLLRPLVLFAAPAIISAVLTGCVWSVGGGKDRVTNTQPTRGAELIDLKKARDAGAITPEEYESKRKQILER